MKHLCALFVAALCIVLVHASDPSYDHQSSTYVANIAPYTTQDSVTVTPFFSPDTSTPTLTQLVQSAQQKIDVFSPDFGSWAYCSSNNGGCVDCTVSYVKEKESFPVWQALLNAVHRGVQVRIMTNDYQTQLCTGKIDPLNYLLMAGAQVRFFATVTFVHDKYIAVDDKKAAVSSVNFSYTSFMMNREAGVLLENNNGIVQYYKSIFERDWAIGLPMTNNQQYSSSDLALIHDTTPIPVVVPPTRSFTCDITSKPQTTVTTAPGTVVTAFASPDFAFDTIMTALNSTRTSLDLSIYQVDMDPLCNQLITLSQRGIALRIFVSDVIYDKSDAASTAICYNRLIQAGLQIHASQTGCVTYSHQKYWIVDGDTVFLSSGNWSATDFPNGSMYFVPYSQPGWRKTNRDMNIKIKSADVAAVFKKVFDLDYSQSHLWHPSRHQSE